MECSVSGCGNEAKYKATGWCQTHYHRNYRTGSIADPVYGDEVEAAEGYRACHARVRSKWGPASLYPCILCGQRAGEYAYDGTDTSELSGMTQAGGVDYPVSWSKWPEFYMPLCFSCHRSRDARLRSERRTHCRNGHELTGDNTYTPAGRYERACRTCRRDEYRRKRVAQGHLDPGPESPGSATGVPNVSPKGSGFRAQVRRNGITRRGPTRRSIEEAISDRDRLLRELSE